MSPPIYTPDGSEVSEIVLPDGSTTSQVIGPDGTVVFEAGPDIPDSAVAQFNAQNLSGFSDGNTVTTWPEEVSGNDGTGSATYRPSAINGHPALEFDGSSDEFSATVGTFSQPNTIFAVVDLETSQYAAVTSERTDAGSNRHNLQYDGNNSSWAIFAGNGLTGADDQAVVLLSTLVDGASTVIRQNGTQTASGDAGSEAFEAVRIGFMPGANGRYFDGYIGFVEIHDGTPTNGLTTREQEIADLWDITL